MPPKGLKRLADETRRVADAIAPAARARAGTKTGFAETLRALQESGALREDMPRRSLRQLRRDVQTLTEAHDKARI